MTKNENARRNAGKPPDRTRKHASPKQSTATAQARQMPSGGGRAAVAPGTQQQPKNKTAKKKNASRKRQITKLDRRKQLFNSGKLGPIKEIQVSLERIVKLRGILFDLDPLHLQPGSIIRKTFETDPDRFYERVVSKWLSRHPVLQKCEVRVSGTGLHAILWLSRPIEFDTDGERDRWAAIVKVIQAALPIDPDQPGITATTRALGSINSKNHAKVRCIAKGQTVSEAELLQLSNDMCERPFATVLQTLMGTDSVSPCPICNDKEAKLVADSHVGHCYGSCGTVKLETLYDAVLKPRSKPRRKSDASS